MHHQNVSCALPNAYISAVSGTTNYNYYTCIGYFHSPLAYLSVRVPAVFHPVVNCHFLLSFNELRRSRSPYSPLSPNLNSGATICPPMADSLVGTVFHTSKSDEAISLRFFQAE